jgi:amino acid adenylation domain-containing protein
MGDDAPLAPVVAPDPGLYAAEPERFRALLADFLAARVAAVARVAPAAVDLDTPPSRLGLDSLAGVELAHAVETELGVALPTWAFLEAASLSALAAEIASRVAAPAAAPAGPAALGTAPTGDHPLSHGQRALWFLQTLAPDSAAYNIVAAARLAGPVDDAALHRAWQALVDRHAALRASFPARSGEPVQRIAARREVDFQRLDAASWSDAELAARMDEVACQPFDLRSEPLLRLRLYARRDRRPRREQERVLLLVVHHIVCDLWSLSILLAELAVLYERETGVDRPPLPPLTASYSEFVLWQEERLAGARAEAAEPLWEHWRGQLAGVAGTLDLPTDRPRPPVRSDHGAAVTLALPPGEADRLHALARRERSTLFAALLAAFQALLHRVTGQDDVVVGSPAAGRSSRRFAGTVGYFVNPLPLRADLARDPAFANFLRKTGETVAGALSHQDFPFDLLVERLRPPRDPNRLPFFEVMLVLEQGLRAREKTLPAFTLGLPGKRLALGGLTLESLARGARRVPFDLTLHAAELDSGLVFQLEHRIDLFDATTARRMLAHLATLLTGAVAEPERPLSALPLLRPAERFQLLSEWNATAREWAAPGTLHEMFAAEARRQPEAEAVVFEGESLCYGDLDRESNRWAHRLRSLGVGPEVLVAVCLERSPAQVIALLGILKAGGAYVPLDPEHPAERLAFVLAETEAPLVLTQRALSGRIPAGRARVLVWEDEEPVVAERSDRAPRPLDITLDPANLAYVIYTSGSTGQPKGAMLTHAGVRNRLLWGLEEQLRGPGKRVLYKTPLAFDVSVWEIFAPLVSGSCLVIARPGAQGDSRYLAELIREQRVTHADFVPSLLQVFLEEPGAAGCTSLERITCAGEALTADLLARSFARLPAAITNVYGPTEASLAVTFWHAERGELERGVPIGRPMDNARIYVVDRFGEQLPMGVAGEVWIGGIALGRGYWRRPERTALSFVPDAWGGEAGARAYRTGDLARLRPDGMLEFLGRIDHQVKVRGFRIELGEIEAALTRHPGVKETVVLAREERGGERRLIAYLVGDGGPAPGTIELRAHLRARLPEYMVPPSFVDLPALPLTANGKIDRQALLARDPGSPRQRAHQEAYIAPRNPTETAVVEIWSAVLGVERVGIEDDFFALGGHSLLASRLLARVEERLGVSLPLGELFTASTPAALAETIRIVERAARGVASVGPPPSGFEEGEL